MASSQATPKQVVDFLTAFKVAMDYGPFNLKDRSKNMQGIMDLGLTINQAKEVIASLTPDNYVAGPKPDDTDARKSVWEFGTRVGNAEVYIKLRLSEVRKGVCCALVWSFHPAEHSMKFPLRGGKS